MTSAAQSVLSTPELLAQILDPLTLQDKIFSARSVNRTWNDAIDYSIGTRQLYDFGVPPQFGQQPLKGGYDPIILSKLPGWRPRLNWDKTYYDVGSEAGVRLPLMVFEHLSANNATSLALPSATWRMLFVSNPPTETVWFRALTPGGWASESHKVKILKGVRVSDLAEEVERTFEQDQLPAGTENCELRLEDNLYLIGMYNGSFADAYRLWTEPTAQLQRPIQLWDVVFRALISLEDETERTNKWNR